MRRASWIPYAAAMIGFSGVWGAFSNLPTQRYGYPAEMVYAVWAVSMVIPTGIVLRGAEIDRRPLAAGYGLAIGLTGAGGQLLLLRALALGPAYLIFPIVALSPAITVILAVVLLRERIHPTATVGVLMTLVAAVLLGYSPGSPASPTGGWMPLVGLVTLAWGVQALLLRKAALVGIGDVTSFAYMTLCGLLLVPIALYMTGDSQLGYPWQAPVLAGGTQLLNAIAALFMVMTLSRGKAALVVPVTSALSPVLTTVLSLAAYQHVPSAVVALGILLAVSGSALTTFDPQRDDDRTRQSTR
ncbi:MAG: EamA family transporter [Nocardioidaceae bacterium]